MKESQIIEMIIDSIVSDGAIDGADKRTCLAWLFDKLRLQKFLEEPTENTKQQEDKNDA